MYCPPGFLLFKPQDDSMLSNFEEICVRRGVERWGAEAKKDQNLVCNFVA